MTAADLQLFPEPDDDGSESREKPASGPQVALGVYPTGARCEPVSAREIGSAPVSSKSIAFPELSDAELAEARRLTLKAYYGRFLAGWHDARIDAGKVSAGTVSTYRTHLTSYDRWEEERAAGDAGEAKLPPDLESRIEAFLADSVRAGHAGTKGRKPWNLKTAGSCWKSLRTILNYARKHGVIAEVPVPDLESLESLDDADRDIAAYSDAQLGKIYAALETVVASSNEIKSRSPRKLQALRGRILAELRTALVVGANCGPRSADLLTLLWDENVRLAGDHPRLIYKAGKTKKVHKVPLAAVTTEHLARLRRSQGLLPGIAGPVFPHLVNLDANDPMDSVPARRSRKLFKAAIAAVGLDAEHEFRKPWQALRAACTTRFNAYGKSAELGRDVGEFITHGPDASIAGQHYDKRLHTVLKAVETIGWPEEFLATG